MEKQTLNKLERFICDLTWGGVPHDVENTRDSLMFQANMKKFETDEECNWKELFEWDKKVLSKYINK